MIHKNSKASSRRQIEIKSVDRGMLVLPGNRFRLILKVTPINVELKSEDEQDVILETFQQILNALPCHIQILTRTRRLDIDEYLAEFRRPSDCHEEDAEQRLAYVSFVGSLVTSNQIVSRDCYVVVSFEAKETDHDQAYEQLLLRAHLIEKQLQRLTIASRRLGSTAVLELFYSFYNETLAKHQPLGESHALF